VFHAEPPGGVHLTLVGDGAPSLQQRLLLSSKQGKVGCQGHAGLLQVSRRLLQRQRQITELEGELISAGAILGLAAAKQQTHRLIMRQYIDPYALSECSPGWVARGYQQMPTTTGWPEGSHITGLLGVVEHQQPKAAPA
jgi:hypothetical protein